MSTNATGLLPGTNYTVLMAVRSGLTLSPGVTALTGVLIPDNHPPDFGVVKLSGDPTIDAANWRFTAKLDITISEKGVVNYAVYGAPSCITGKQASTSSAWSVDGVMLLLPMICVPAQW